MSKKANKTVIGAFVIGAIALIVAGVVVFGSGKFFAPTKKYVMFFQGSVKGLQVGAPVIFRGVKVGQVFDIRINFHPSDLTADIPVYIEIDPRLLTVPEEYKHILKQRKKYWFIKPLIDKGLRAQLQTQSFVTGQLAINLDLHPDKPIRLLGVEKKYPEIPTIPSSIEQLTKTIQDLPLKEITEKLDSVLEGLDEIVHSPEVSGSIASLNRTLKHTDRLVVNLDGRIGPLVADLRSTLEGARGTLASVEKSFSMEDGVPARLGETMEKADKALQQAEMTLAAIQTTSKDASNVGYELNSMLRELSEAARSIRFLADYIDRHPEAFIRGKKDAGGE